VEGVKFHPLYVVKGTALEKAYAEKRLVLLERAEYAGRVGRFLEQLWPQTVIQRLTADCPPELLIAPAWLAGKSAVIREIEAWLRDQETCQGQKYSQ
jgi:radical SAM superfamily enzyme